MAKRTTIYHVSFKQNLVDLVALAESETPSLVKLAQGARDLTENPLDFVDVAVRLKP